MLGGIKARKDQETSKSTKKDQKQQKKGFCSLFPSWACSAGPAAGAEWHQVYTAPPNINIASSCVMNIEADRVLLQWLMATCMKGQLMLAVVFTSIILLGRDICA